MGLRPYHSGQIQAQEEAQSRRVAEKLAGWTGPVGPYAVKADLFLLSYAGEDTFLRHAAFSGPPPLVEQVGDARLRLHDALATILRPAVPVQVGGLVISLARAERARINGFLRPTTAGGLELEATETFTLCRKYMAPSEIVDPAMVRAGPRNRERITLETDWAARLLATAETAFLATVAPDGAPDVAHRGGPPGFLSVDPATSTVTWPEWVGDGVFKSAGNVRATSTATLLVPDLATGDALELAGQATYETVLFQRRPRVDPLLQLPDAFPVQGRMALCVESATRLVDFAGPRRTVAGERVTSCSSVDDQAPV